MLIPNNFAKSFTPINCVKGAEIMGFFFDLSDMGVPVLGKGAPKTIANHFEIG